MALITRGNNMRLLRGGRVQALIMPGRPRDSVFSPSDLFTNGEQGSVHVARDLNTLISTAAGSTPDVVLNGYAGKWLDQSGLGNHATQSTSTARPQLSARYNLLTYSEDLTAWSSALCGGTATKLVANAGASLSSVFKNQSIAKSSVSQQYHLSFWAAPAEFNQMQILIAGASTANRSVFTLNLASGNLVGSVTNIGLVSTQSVTTSALDGGGYAVSVLFTSDDSATIQLRFYPTDSVATTGNGTSGITVTSVSVLRQADRTAIPYQRVTSATNYDSAGFPQFLAFDADDALVATYPSSLGSNCTVCIGRAATTPLILTGQTIGTTYTLNAAAAERVTGLIVINRALSALETEQVTSYLQARS